MVIRKQPKAEKEEVKEVEVTDEEENKIPMIPNYLDLILGELNAIRVMLENQQEE